MTSTSVWRWRVFWLVWSPWWCHGISVQCWWWGQFCPIKMNDLHFLQRDVHKSLGWRWHQIPLLKLPFSSSFQLQKDVPPPNNVCATFFDILRYSALWVTNWTNWGVNYSVGARPSSWNIMHPLLWALSINFRKMRTSCKCTLKKNLTESSDENEMTIANWTCKLVCQKSPLTGLAKV